MAVVLHLKPNPRGLGDKCLDSCNVLAIGDKLGRVRGRP